jgi:hypothetical protein
MRYALLALFCIAVSTLPAGQPISVRLGSGHRGLVLKHVNPFDPKEHPFTFALACNLNPGYSIQIEAPEGGPNVQVILKESFTQEYVNSLPSNFFGGWFSLGLFSFDEDAAFEGRTLIRIEHGHIRIYPGIALQEARNRYQLKENEIFLGAFDGRIFFWIKDQPQAVYFKSAKHTYRFKLSKRVTEPLGMAKGDPKGDLALYTVMLPAGWFSFTPRTVGWLVLNVKDAERVD